MGQKVKISWQDSLSCLTRFFFLILRNIFLLRISCQDKLSCVWDKKISLILKNIVKYIKQDFHFLQ